MSGPSWTGPLIPCAVWNPETTLGECGQRHAGRVAGLSAGSGMPRLITPCLGAKTDSTFHAADWNRFPA